MNSELGFTCFTAIEKVILLIQPLQFYSSMLAFHFEFHEFIFTVFRSYNYTLMT